MAERIDKIDQQESYVNALAAGAKFSLGLNPSFVNNGHKPAREEIIAWGQAVEKAADVASNPLYAELRTLSQNAFEVSSLKREGYNGSLYGQMLDIAYKRVENPIINNKTDRVTSRELVRLASETEATKNVPRDQVAKLAFVEAMAAYTFAKLVKVRTSEGKDEQRTLVTVAEAKDEIGRVRDKILSGLTKAMKGGNYETFEERYKLNLEGVDLKLLRTYAGQYLTNPRDEGNSIFCMDPKALVKLNEEISSADTATKKEKLLGVKKALGGISQAVYREIDERIDKTALQEVEQAMRNNINFIEGNPLKPRKNTIVMINGHTGAGKGTTLGMLNTKAVETGTDGIAGRGEGFEQYELVMGPYDMARVAGEFIPSKVMKLLFATEMMAARQKLDQEGRVHEPVYVSGFPRSAEQAATFDGINNIKSVALTITERTAVTRTLTRIGLFLRENQIPREDDFNDIELEGEDLKKEFIEATVGASILINKHKEGDFIMNLSQHIDEKVAPIFKMNSKSRYFKYDNAIKSINNALSQNSIKTKFIECDGKSPEEVTTEVRQAIGI